MREPEVELSECIRCGVCQEVCPEVFDLGESGYVRIAVLPVYPADCVDEAIKHCPAGCISWMDSETTGGKK